MLNVIACCILPFLLICFQFNLKLFLICFYFSGDLSLAVLIKFVLNKKKVLAEKQTTSRATSMIFSSVQNKSYLPFLNFGIFVGMFLNFGYFLASCFYKKDSYKK